MELQGKVIEIKEKQTFSEKFTIQSIIIETVDQYPQVLKLDFINQKIELLQKIELGKLYTYSIVLQGRKWINPTNAELSYFTSIKTLDVS